MAELPKPFLKFRRMNSRVARAYDALGEASATAGPLPEQTRELVKLAMAIGARLEGAVHAHVRRARAAGVTAQQIRHVVALAAPTLGFPTTVAAFTWVEESLSSRAGRSARQTRR